MAIIEGFRVRNYRALKDVTLGKLWNLQDADPLTPMTTVIGKNGVGKSTLTHSVSWPTASRSAWRRPATRTNAAASTRSVPRVQRSRLRSMSTTARTATPARSRMSWLLGDRHAITTACSKAKTAPLDAYTQDSICGTWDVLADAVYPGGAEPLKKRGFPHTGQAKCEWAEQIAPHMDVDANKSRSFNVFKQAFEKLANLGIEELT
jgi:hypothetical protein